MTLAGRELAWGPGGGAPGGSGVLGKRFQSDEHICIPYLLHWQDTNWCWVQGAEPPEAQGFYTLNYRQMGIFLYLMCDTIPGQELAWGPGDSPRKLTGFGQYITDRWAYFDTSFVTLIDRELAWGPGGRAPGGSEVLDNRLRSHEHPGARLRAVVVFRGQSPGSSGL